MEEHPNLRSRLNKALTCAAFMADDAACMVRQLEADRELLVEYGDEIASLRKRLEEAERLNKTYREGLLDENGLVLSLRTRLEEAEKSRQVLAKALTALYRHEDATADALAELAGFETWEEVYIAALAGEKP